MLPKTQKNEKGPLSHRKIICLFLDYVQLLIIGQVIWAKNVDQNVKKQKRPPKLSKNKMFIFRLCSTSDDRLSHPSKKRRPKCKTMKKAPKVIKKSNVHFWITFNFWWLAEQSEQKTLTEMQKNEKGPLSHQKIKCSFLDYVQLLMIGQSIRAKNIDRNVKKLKRLRKLSKNQMFIFRLCSTSDDQLSDPSKKHRPKCKKIKKAP